MKDTDCGVLKVNLIGHFYYTHFYISRNKKIGSVMKHCNFWLENGKIPSEVNLSHKLISCHGNRMFSWHYLWQITQPYYLPPPPPHLVSSPLPNCPFSICSDKKSPCHLTSCNIILLILFSFFFLTVSNCKTSKA